MRRKRVFREVDAALMNLRFSQHHKITLDLASVSECGGRVALSANEHENERNRRHRVVTFDSVKKTEHFVTFNIVFAYLISIL